MRCLTTKIKILSLNYSQIRHISKSSKLTKSKKPPPKPQTDTTKFTALFNELTQLLGSDDAFKSRNASVQGAVDDGVFVDCTEGICVNANKNLERKIETLPGLEDTQLGVGDRGDVSLVVHEVTKVVRGEDGGVGMEERLRDLNVKFDEEVVDLVLKRCFKVPLLGFRFFSWVEGRDGFRHTSRTFNTMLYIAGEAREFDLVDKLVEDMERSCGKDVKTWTIMLSLCGKRKGVGKALLVFESLRKSGCEPDRAAYREIIRLLCNALNADVAMEFYREMVQREMVLDLNSFKLLLKCVAKSGDVASVHLVADDMIKIAKVPVREVYGCVLRSFCISGMMTEALEVIRDLRSREMTMEPGYFEVLVKGLCRANRIADALEIVEIIKKKHLLSGKVYEIIIDGYLRKNDLSKALDVFQMLKESGQVPTISTYTGLMQHLFMLGAYQKGCELYDDLLASGVELDSVVITAMVAGHVHHNHVPEAWEVFRSMRDKGIKPTWKSYSVFVKELCKQERTDEIIKVLNEMQASKLTIGDEIFSWVISYLEKKGDKTNIGKIKQWQRTYKLGPHKGEGNADDTSKEHELDLGRTQSDVRNTNSVAQAVSKPYDEQDLLKVCEILGSSLYWPSSQEILEKSSIQFTPELVLEVLIKCGMHGNAALHFFSWLKKQPGYRHTTKTYNMAVKIAGRGKDFKHMRDLFYEMRRNRLLTPDTWTIVIMQYGRTGLTEIALQFFEKMKAEGFNPTGSTYKYVITILCGRKGRKVDVAIKIFNEMTRAGHVPDKELVETYLGCLCDAGKFSDAKNATDYLRKVGSAAPLSYAIYIRALCRVGKLEEALELIKEAGAERSTLERCTSGSIVHCLLQKGQINEALARVDSLKQAGICPTTHEYTSLIVYFLKEKNIETALEIFNNMQQEGCEPTVATYSALIHGYMTMGKVKDAWDVFHQMKTKGTLPDFKTYSILITSLCSMGRSEEALQLISEMRNTGIVPSTVNFRTVLYGLNREGKQELARSVLKQKLSLINNRRFIT